jgi:hypothetical protein
VSIKLYDSLDNEIFPGMVLLYPYINIGVETVLEPAICTKIYKSRFASINYAVFNSFRIQNLTKIILEDENYCVKDSIIIDNPLFKLREEHLRKALMIHDYLKSAGQFSSDHVLGRPIINSYI